MPTLQAIRFRSRYRAKNPVENIRDVLAKKWADSHVKSQQEFYAGLPAQQNVNPITEKKVNRYSQDKTSQLTSCKGSSWSSCQHKTVSFGLQRDSAPRSIWVENKVFGGDRKLGAGVQWRNHRERESGNRAGSCSAGGFSSLYQYASRETTKTVEG